MTGAEGDRRRDGSALAQTAAALRALAMTRAEGSFLGSEEELMRQFGVSRPTLRQASAQVAQENLIVIRRGVGGGYFTRRPDSMTVARIAALYLQSHDAGLEETLTAIEPIRVSIAVLATHNPDPVYRERLAAFLAAEEAAEAGSHEHGYRAFLKSERAFGKLIGAMSGNRVLTLFLAILYDFAGHLGPDEDVLVNRPGRIAEYRKQRRWMARAILDGDEELAVLATRRCSAIITHWMHEDLAGRGFAQSAGADG